MLVTNDVALITFVPFAVLVLKRIGKESALTRIVILQTLAANLGSMATPIGNPQNLFLCSYYSLGMGDFLRVVAPLTAVSLVLLGVVAASARKETIEIEFSEAEKIRQPKLFALLCALFLMCLLSVVHILHYGILTAVVFVCLVLFARGLFKKVDYALLATFVCFFVFAGNIGRIEPIRNVLELLMERSAYWTSLLASQVISNVPAAVLLSGFTDNWSGIIAGVDVGGLGTPISSLASLITLGEYRKRVPGGTLRYLGLFSLINFSYLAVLIGVSYLNDLVLG